MGKGTDCSNMRADRHLANFANRWQVEQVRIVMMCGQVIGWLQTASTDDSLFLSQLFIDTRFQVALHALGGDGPEPLFELDL